MVRMQNLPRTRQTFFFLQMLPGPLPRTPAMRTRCSQVGPGEACDVAKALHPRSRT